MRPFEVEDAVRLRLGRMFGTNFRKRKLQIGFSSKKMPQLHEFDVVSEDLDIIGEIKSGRLSGTNYSSAIADCVYLSRVKARMRLMVFTDEELYAHFRSRSEGVIDASIFPILVTNEELSVLATF